MRELENCPIPRRPAWDAAVVANTTQETQPLQINTKVFQFLLPDVRKPLAYEKISYVHFG